MPNDKIPLEALAYAYRHDKIWVLEKAFERCNLSPYLLKVIGSRVDENCRVAMNNGRSHEWFAAMEYYRNGRIRILFPWKGKHGLVRQLSVSSDLPLPEYGIAFLCHELIEQMKPYEFNNPPKAL